MSGEKDRLDRLDRLKSLEWGSGWGDQTVKKHRLNSLNGLNRLNGLDGLNWSGVCGGDGESTTLRGCADKIGGVRPPPHRDGEGDHEGVEGKWLSELRSKRPATCGGA